MGRIVDVPEHRFTENQIAELIKLLGANSANLPRLRGETLPDAARWFTSSLVQQNYPPNSKIDKSLERIESAASRLRLSLSNPLTKPYMRFAAGDVTEDDRRLHTAVIAVENLKHWSKEARQRISQSEEKKRRDEAKAERATKRKTKGKGKGKPTRTAMRVLIHRLALLWLRTHNGKAPTVSVKRDSSSSGEFLQFAQSYIKAMRQQTTDEHRQCARNVDKELAVSADAIVSHLRAFNARLPRRT